MSFVKRTVNRGLRGQDLYSGRQVAPGGKKAGRVPAHYARRAVGGEELHSGDPAGTSFGLNKKKDKDGNEIPNIDDYFVSPFQGDPNEPSPYTNEGGQAAIASFDRYQTETNHATQLDDYGKIQSHQASYHILGAAGLSDKPSKDNAPVGVNFDGQTIYSSNVFRNSRDTAIGQQTIDHVGKTYTDVNAFSNNEEAARFSNIGAQANNPDYIATLDNHRANKDPNAFVNTLGSVSGSPVDKDKTGYTSYKVYENWDLMSPAQKSASIAGVGISGYKFSDGKGVADKTVTPEIPNTPSMKLHEVSTISATGANVSSAVNKWPQVTAIQDTFYKTDSPAVITQQAAAMGSLGYGKDGAAVPVTKEQLTVAKAAPEPHYGVGAVSIPKGGGIPQGYVKTASIDTKDIIIPTVNKTSSVIQNPVVASDNAKGVYKNWKPTEHNQVDRGVVGGSAMVGTLHAMGNMNPHSLGAVMVNDAYSSQPPPKDQKPSDLDATARLMAVNYHRLSTGSTSAETDALAPDHKITAPMTEENFHRMRMSVRGDYAKQGISSKETGYQLANQAYAERRFNETQVVSAHKTLDMIYDDDGYTTAQKLMTGKDKGLQITESRRG